MKKMYIVLAAILAFAPSFAFAIDCDSTDSLCARSPGDLTPRAKIDANGKIETGAELELPEQAAPGTPASGRGAIYFKTDGKLYFKNDAGSETEVGAGGGHTIAESSGTVGADLTPATDRANLVFSTGTWFVLTDDPDKDATIVSLSTGPGTTTNKVWQEVESITLSGTSASFGTTLDPNKEYQIIANVDAVSADTRILMRFNAEAGTGYNWQTICRANNSVACGLLNSAGAAACFMGSNSTYDVESGEGGRALMYFSADADDDTYIRYTGRSSFNDGNTTDRPGSEICGGYHNASAALSSVSIETLSAATLSGTAKLLVLDYVNAVVGNADCPDDFLALEGGGNRLGCIQTAEEGSSGWVSASNDCLNTYGGRLPSHQEGWLAANNLALTAETDDKEWAGDAGPGTDLCWANDFTDVGSGGGEAFACGTSVAYRCWIPR